VIMGHIIPAGTGFEQHRQVWLKPLVEELPPLAAAVEALTGEAPDAPANE